MSNQSINPAQWQTVVAAAENHAQSLSLPKERLYTDFRSTDEYSYRESIFDSYGESNSRIIFNYDTSTKNGRISIYNSTERIMTPATLKQALNISNNIFTSDSDIISNDIVAKYLKQQTNLPCTP
jgi:hypothetical protein